MVKLGFLRFGESRVPTSLPLLPDPLSSGLIARVRVPFTGQINLFKNDSIGLGPKKKKKKKKKKRRL